MRELTSTPRSGPNGDVLDLPSRLPAGVTLMEGAIDSRRLPRIAEAYDREMRNANDADVSVGSTTTRVLDFVNRGPAFDELYIYEPLLTACRTILPAGFRLSSFHARTVRPNAAAQQLHLDLEHDAHGPRLVSFIYMVDEFTLDNGATFFGANEAVKACGPAGSLIVFDGAIPHGHSANATRLPRRSLQGAFIRRPQLPATDFIARMSVVTLERLSATALSVLT